MIGAVPVFVDIDPETLQPRPGAPRGGRHPEDARRGAGAPLRAARGDGRDRRHRPARAASPWSPTPPRRWARATAAGRSARGATRHAVVLPDEEPRRRAATAAWSSRRATTSRERVRLLRDHGSVAEVRARRARLLSRLDELQAALLRVKLARLAEWTDARRRLAARYRDGARRPRPRPARRAAARAPRVPSVHRPRARAATRSPPRSPTLGVGTSVHYPTILPCQPLFGRARRRARLPARGAGGDARCSACPASRRSPTRRSTRSWARRARTAVGRRRGSSAALIESAPRGRRLAAPAAVGEEPLRLRRG